MPDPPTRGRGLPRPLEAVLAFLALVLAAPLLAVAALAVAATSPGGALFRQTRIGRDGRPFTLLKLRSMRSGPSGAAVTAAGDPRITPIGRLLRRTKLDELPELWNVVRGDLALVGPRPDVPQFVDLSTPAWRDVLAVRPGLTHPVTLRLRDEEGLLAAAGGDRERFYRDRLLPWKLDGYLAYETARTPWRDLAVLAATVSQLLRVTAPAPPTQAELAAPPGRP